MKKDRFSDLFVNTNTRKEKIMTKDKQQWLEGRRRGIGGSDVAAVLQLSPWMFGTTSSDFLRSTR